MSDNVIRPGQWVQNGQQSLEKEGPTQPEAEFAPGGGGPHDPGMEFRVADLEKDMKDVRSSLGRLEAACASITATLEHVATKADVVAGTGAANVVAERVSHLDARLGKVERSIDEVVKSAVGKAIGPVQLPAIIVATVVALGVLATGGAWLLKQVWFPLH